MDPALYSSAITDDNAINTDIDTNTDTIQPWTTPMIWNTPSFRIIALITPVTFLAYRSTLPFHTPFQYPLAILHLSSWGINVGTNFYTTFVAGITMFKALPRREFGKLQAKVSENKSENF
jgi:hypothetical protein